MHSRMTGTQILAVVLIFSTVALIAASLRPAPIHVADRRSSDPIVE